jgi:hypothetical protein
MKSHNTLLAGAFLCAAVFLLPGCSKNDKATPGICLLVQETYDGPSPRQYDYNGTWTYGYDAGAQPASVSSDQGNLINFSANQQKGTYRYGVIKNFAFTGGSFLSGMPAAVTIDKPQSGPPYTYQFYYNGQRLISRSSKTDSVVYDYDGSGNMVRSSYYSLGVSATVPFSYTQYTGFDNKATPYAGSIYYKFLYHSVNGFYSNTWVESLVLGSHNPGRLQSYTNRGNAVFSISDDYSFAYQYNDKALPTQLIVTDNLNGKAQIEHDQFTYSCK